MRERLGTWGPVQQTRHQTSGRLDSALSSGERGESQGAAAPPGPSPVALPPALPLAIVSDMHRNSIETPLVTRLPPSGHRWSLTFLAVTKAEEPTEA